MSRLKTIAGAWAIAFGLAGHVHAAPKFHEIIAACTGRLSAEMEHAWLMSDDEAADLAAQRAGFVAILEAVMPAEDGRAVLAQRIEAKFAHERLLNTAAFSSDAARADWAARQARVYVTQCKALLLGG